jgi:hypothetical protein
MVRWRQPGGSPEHKLACRIIPSTATFRHIERPHRNQSKKQSLSKTVRESRWLVRALIEILPSYV